MSKLLWSSDPVRREDPRKELAREAWMAAVEHARPELFTVLNDHLDEVNAFHAAFDEWWKQQIDQCLYITADPTSITGHWACLLPTGHEGEHCPSDYAKKHVAADATWILPEHLAWRQRRIKQQP